MFPVVLYFIGGVVLGLEAFASAMLAVWGAPTSVVQLIGVVGGLGLVVASVLGLFTGRAAGLVALGASLLGWTFYLPASLTTLSVVGRNIVGLLFVLVPVALLTSTTVHGFCRLRHQQSPEWLFPTGATPRS